MKNFIQTGKSIDIIAPSTIVGGTLITVGDLVGVAVTDSDSAFSDDLVSITTEGVFEVAKTAGVLSMGDKVMVPTASFSKDVGVRADTGSGIYVGIAVETVLSAATSIKVKLNA